MKLTGSQLICRLLEKAGIKIVAGIPGGSILPLYNELNKSSIRHILVRQEQAAGFIAQGMARTTGLPAVCLATSGPGAMNLLTSIADARSDSIPIIAITGQVNSNLIGTDAFQEADTFGLSFPITKHSIAVKKAEELLTAIPEAFAIACEGRPGPVLIDVPRNVQLETVQIESLPEINCSLPEQNVRFHTSQDKINELTETAAKLLADSQKPVLYIGGGCNSPKGAEVIRNFKDAFPLPVVSSLMGLGVVSATDEDFAGMVGMHGFLAANKAMHDSDLVLACGVRFDDRATGLTQKFCPDAKIIHIDIDAAEINKILPAKISIVSKIESALPQITSHLKLLKNSCEKLQKRIDWLNEIKNLKKSTFSMEAGSCRANGAKLFECSVNPRKFMAELPEYAQKAGLSKNDLLVTTDVGQHQMFAAQYYPVENPRTFLTSGSLGTMGFGLPAAIGASLANPSKRVVCFSGDGSIMMNIQELATLQENNLAVTVIVFINRTLGMVYQQQKFLFDKNYSASVFSDEKTDFLKISEGFGIESTCANTDALWYKKAFDSSRKNKPFFVTVYVEPEEEVLPYVPGGKANIDAILHS